MAEAEEVLAIAEAVGKASGIMQTVMNFPDIEREMALIGDGAAMCRAAIFSEVCNPSPEMRQRRDETVRQFREEGKNITAFTVPRSAGGIGGLTTPNFWHTPAWSRLREMDLETRLAALRDGDFRERLVDDLRSGEHAERIIQQTRNWYPMGMTDRAYYTGGPDESRYGIAEANGEHPAETWIRLSLESKGQVRFHMRVFKMNLDDVADGTIDAFAGEDVNGDGVADNVGPEKGTVMRIITNKTNQLTDEFTVTAPKQASSVAKDDVQMINVFPNPYMGRHELEGTDSVLPLPKYVTFNHLPTSQDVYFKVFNVAGTMVANFQKTTTTQYQRWNMRNSNDFPLASGVYVIHIDMPGLGTSKVLKFAMVTEEEFSKRF